MPENTNGITTVTTINSKNIEYISRTISFPLKMTRVKPYQKAEGGMGVDSVTPDFRENEAIHVHQK